MRGTVVAVVIAVTGAGSASATPVDPQGLPRIVATGGSGEPAAVYSAGADADLVLDALATADFVAIAGAQPLDGRLDGPAAAVFDAVAARSGAVRLPRGLKPGVDLDRHGVP